MSRFNSTALPTGRILDKSSPKTLLALAVASVLGLSSMSHAAVITWSGAGTTWATGSNWVGGVAPANNLTSDIARFDSATHGTNPTAGTTSVLGVQIGSNSNFFSLGGTNLSIGASGISMEAGAGPTANAGSIIAPATVTIGASQTWTNSSTAN